MDEVLKDKIAERLFKLDPRMENIPWDMMSEMGFMLVKDLYRTEAEAIYKLCMENGEG